MAKSKSMAKPTPGRLRSMKNSQLTKAGKPRKRAPGAGRKPSGTIRVVAYVQPETYDWIDAVQIEQGCTMGQAIDILRASAK